MRSQEEPGRERGSGGSGERLFIGVPLPAVLLERVVRAQEALPPLPGLRPIRPAQLHITLAFIGAADPEAALAARAVVAGVPAELGGRARLGSYLVLPNARRARVVSLELDDEEGVFARLFEYVMAGLERVDVMKREKRPFRPHLTIARLREPETIRPTMECDPVPYPVQSVCLYRSDLRPSGAEYTVLVRTDLGRGPGSSA